MPFGKYRGVNVEALPEPYLLWLLENIDLREPLRSAVEEALTGETDPPVGISNEVKAMAKQVIDSGYRTLAQRFHPDLGGRHMDMVNLNEARKWLKERAA